MSRRTWIVLVIALFLVAGAYVYRSQVFHTGDEFIYQRIHTFGEDHLARPVGIALDEEQIYVTDTDNNRIVVYDREGNKLGSGGSIGDGPGQFRPPMHLDVGPDGNVYVADQVNHRIQIFTPRGELRDSIGEYGTEPGQLNEPAGVAVRFDGSLLVTDFHNHRVQGFDRGGESEFVFGSPGPLVHVVRGLSRQGFRYPIDVEVAGDGSWYVADAFNHRIKKYTSEDDLAWIRGGLFGLGIPGSFPGWFTHTHGLALSPDDERVYVADFDNHRIQIYSSDGTYLGRIEREEFFRPIGLAVDEERLYVVNHGRDQIVILERAR